jgi:hypothetical protein
MLKTNLKNSLIQSFYDKFSAFSNIKNYLFIGKVTEWDNETLPPTADDSLNEELEAWRNMLLCKSLNSDDVAFVIRRINWEYNKVFSQYDDVIELYSETNNYDFYVYTSGKNVYKCISNNNGSFSQYEPSGTSTDDIITQDGYIWKYMYSVRPELEDFITEEYIPVELLDELFYTDQRSLQLTVQQDAKQNKNGAITSIQVTQTGASYPFAIDYVTNPEAQIFHVVQETVNVGSFTIKLNPLSDISRINDIYKNDYVVYIYSGTGSGQVRKITAYNGESCIATVSEAFTEQITTDSYYKILPRIEIIGDGRNAVAIPILNPLTKMIESVTILNGGENYRKAIVEIKSKRTNDIDLTKARAILAPVNGHGYSSIIELGCKDLMIKSYFDKEEIQDNNFYNDYRQVGLIQDIELLNEITPKQKYTLDIENLNATTALTLGGNYSTFVSVLQSNPNLIVKQGSDDNISQAQGTYLSFDSTTETLILKTVNGKFMNYPSSTVYPLVIEDYPTTGTDTYYTSVNVLNCAPLNYYSDLTFKLDDTILGEDSKTTGTVVDWKPTFFGTDGKLVVTDVNGSFDESYYNDSGDLINGERIIAFSAVNMTSGISGFNENKVGIIKNISKAGLTEGKTSYRTTTALTLRSVNNPITDTFSETDFSEDDIIKQETSGATGIVVSWKLSDDKTTGTLLLTGVDGAFDPTPTSGQRILKLVGGSYTSTYKDFNVGIYDIKLPEVSRYSGKMLYIENIRPVVRGDDQMEEFKIIIGL